jgi:hypothetical protein
MMTQRMKTWLTGLTLVTTLGALGITAAALDRQATDLVEAPRFEVDPMWPKPLPNHWVLGSTIGVDVDAKDHVWIVHRNDTLQPNEGAAGLTPPAGKACCRAAGPRVRYRWHAAPLLGGPGPGYEWPVSNHGISH